MTEDAPRGSHPLYGMALVVTCIVVVGSLLYSFVILGLASNAVCDRPPAPLTSRACFDRYQAWWLAVLACHGLAVIGAILLDRLRGERWSALALAVLGTVGPATLFTIAFDVPV
jgi:hypothetical protein